MKFCLQIYCVQPKRGRENAINEQNSLNLASPIQTLVILKTFVSLALFTHQSAVEKPADCDGGGEDPGHVADDDAPENLKRGKKIRISPGARIMPRIMRVGVRRSLRDLRRETRHSGPLCIFRRSRGRLKLMRSREGLRRLRPPFQTAVALQRITAQK